uniref:NBR1 autophagy cargo receptor a n=1 Tax=Cynoglossus semilaevis TaxID=244447 RepID=A0A3P8WE89_CYNSE
SVCPSCILCEMCRHSHDPSHNLVRTKTPLSIPEFPRRGDRTVRKAERQRLKAERRQLRAEVKEIKKKLRLEKRGLQWSGPSTSGRKPGLFSTMLCTLETRDPEVSPSSLVPTMAALFLDENLPDGTRLEPGTKFIKYWKMRNSGTISWTSETKLMFMWGNLGLASEKKREVPVPLLLPGQVGVVSVAFVAPMMEGTYTSHWRLAHCGCQFGPRVWCSIVVDPCNNQSSDDCYSLYLNVFLFKIHQLKLKETIKVTLMPFLSVSQKDEVRLVEKERELRTIDVNHDDYYFPSVDLLTAQDLLSFELLDINIVQELEKVPNNTPVDLTPCISPLPHDPPVWEKTITLSIREDKEFTVGQQKDCLEPALMEEDKEEEISGAQFLFETVIRSLTLEEAPDHRPPRRGHPNHQKPMSKYTSMDEDGAPLDDMKVTQDEKQEEGEEGGARGEDWDEMLVYSFHASAVLQVCSQTSSASSCDDYIIVLPDCFDTSRPLGESMYSSAMSQPDITASAAEDSAPPPVLPIHSSVNQMLFASQTLDAVTLTPEVVSPPILPDPVVSPPTLYSPRLEGAGSTSTVSERTSCSLGQGGITEGLVKGALSVAASAYKALFTGPNCTIQVHNDPSMMAMLLEMGFKNQRLNQRLLRKHSYSLLHTVNELVQMAEEEQNAAVDALD